MVDDRGKLLALVEQLQGTERRAGWTRTLRVGALLLGTLCDGDAEQWRNQRKNPDNPVSRLARHAGCPFSEPSLVEAVNVFILQRDLPGVVALEGITPSHVYAVRGLPRDVQLGLLEKCSRQKLGVRALSERATAARRLRGERRGRPALPAAHKALTRLDRASRTLAAAERLLAQAAFVDDETSRRIAEKSDTIEKLVMALKEHVFGPRPKRTSEPSPLSCHGLNRAPLDWAVPV